ncbi:hypothetical protein OQA88_6659 [Cercophora sp. LCS_1]
MALQTNLSAVPQQFHSNITHDIMVYQTIASALWSYGGISQIYATYSLNSIIWSREFRVALIAFLLLFLAAKFYVIKSKKEIAWMEMESKKEIARMETESRKEIARMEMESRKEIARMEMVMELEKTRMQLNDRSSTAQSGSHLGKAPSSSNSS